MRTVIGFLTLLALALAVPPCVAQDSTAPGDTRLGVLSFNIRYGTAQDGENAWANRRDRVFDVIRDGVPPEAGGGRWALIGLQEALAFQIHEILAAAPGYGLVGVGRDDGERAGEFSAILYDRERLSVIDSGTRWLSATPEEPGSTTWGNSIPRVFTWASFAGAKEGARPRRAEFVVVNTHWDHRSQESRLESAKAIAFWLRDRERFALPKIVLGDFNAGERNPAMRWLGDDARLRDTWRVLHPRQPEPATFSAWRDEARVGDKIDSVLVSHQWRTLHAGIDRRATDDGRTPSDHFPVWAVIESPRR